MARALSATIAAALFFSFPALAAGIDSRTYTCPAVHALIAAKGFVFINNPDFEDIVVANGSYCSGDQIIQLRSVATGDNPECLVNFCRSVTSGDGTGINRRSARHRPRGPAR